MGEECEVVRTEREEEDEERECERGSHLPVPRVFYK